MIVELGFVLVLVFVRQVQVLQGQAELSAIKTTLGALRTALVIEHLRLKAGGASQSAPSNQRPWQGALQADPERLSFRAQRAGGG